MPPFLESHLVFRALRLKKPLANVSPKTPLVMSLSRSPSPIPPAYWPLNTSELELLLLLLIDGTRGLNVPWLQFFMPHDPDL